MAGRQWWRRVGRAAAGVVVAASAVAVATASSSELSGASSALWPTRTVMFGPCRHDGARLAMDLYLPPPSAGVAPWPVAMFVHGGGWAQRRRSEGPLFADITAGLVEQGIAVASPDYRLAPDHTWPAPLDDVECALAQIGTMAAPWQLDPSRVGAWGVSAGGHLVSLAGTRPAGPVALVAVADLYGPADLAAAGWPVSTGALIAQEFGSSPAVLREASPRRWASAEDPPFLVVHGDADRSVPLAQSEHFVRALRAAGVETDFVVVPGGTHGLGDRPEVAARVISFLAERLNRALAPP